MASPSFLRMSLRATRRLVNHVSTIDARLIKPSAIAQRALSSLSTVRSSDSDTQNAKLGALGTTVTGQKLNIRRYPKFATLEEERLYRKQHLAGAFRM